MPPSGDGNLPRDGRALLGPLLTERQFARRAALSPGSVRRHRSIPRVDSPIGVGAAYPAFMLDDHGLRLDVAFIVLLLRRRMTDLEACDWLVRRNGVLGDRPPLDWITDGLALETVIEAMSASAEGERPASTEVDAIREEWLRFRGDETTPGWTIAWDKIARQSAPTPHGV